MEGRLARKPCILRVVGSDALPWRAIPLVQLHLKVLIQKCSILWIKLDNLDCYSRALDYGRRITALIQMRKIFGLKSIVG